MSTVEEGPVRGLRFDNAFTRELPADPLKDRSPRPVKGSCYSRVHPTPVPGPRLLAWSREVMALLGMPEDAWETDEFLQVFSGNQVLDAMDPYAMCYGGHQFGNWAGQLGDGRAINLGEVMAPDGGRWTLQLKGAGTTPYSRFADGLAVLRSSVREFLCSEAMHHLGVPTTRALSLVTTGQPVNRDMFYDGHPRHEPGAIVCRVAPSFVRFGNFEIFASRRELDPLRQLIDHTIRTDFPHLGPVSTEVRKRWFEEVCLRTARMVVHWMRVGFVHGVMNTDNMSVLGLTIDYGPYGWLENFDPGWTPNTTDAAGRRYRFGNQPQIASWNLARFAEAVSFVIEDTDSLEASLAAYAREFEVGWQKMMADKLGLAAFDPALDQPLVEDLLELLQTVETDMTIFHRNLSRIHETPDADWLAVLSESYYVQEQLTDEYKGRMAAWLTRYRARAAADGTDPTVRRRQMDAVNPKYVLRNYLAQVAIDKAEQGDPGLIMETLEVLRRPYDEQPGREAFALRRPDWARHRPGCSMLSCSS